MNVFKEKKKLNQREQYFDNKRNCQDWPFLLNVKRLFFFFQYVAWNAHSQSLIIWQIPTINKRMRMSKWLSTLETLMKHKFSNLTCLSFYLSSSPFLFYFFSCSYTWNSNFCMTNQHSLINLHIKFTKCAPNSVYNKYHLNLIQKCDLNYLIFYFNLFFIVAEFRY